MALLSVSNLSVEYWTNHASYLKAVDGVSFQVEEGEVIGLAGESGCGKSTLAHSILRILPRSARVTGSIMVNGSDVMKMDERSARNYRWKQVSLVPQASMNAFDPVIPVGAQIVESIRIHDSTPKPAAWKRTRELFALVGISEKRVREYPHQFSGGMKQRAAIAMALSLEPKLVILDEPTTALDVIVQKQILNLLKRLQKELGITILFVTHDLSVLSDIATRIAVMYAGKIAEIGPSSEFFKSPKHPYGRALIQAIPTLRGDLSSVKGIQGAPPNLLSPPSGCRFHPRCPFVFDRCKKEEPELLNVEGNAMVACHLFDVGGGHVES